MKRIISTLLCVCMLVGFLNISVSAALMGLTSVGLTVTEPKSGEKPGEVKISGTFSEITNVRWEGLDANGCFALDSDYTVYVNFSLTANSAKKYEYLADKLKVTVNSSREAEIIELTPSTAQVKYTFKKAGAEFAQDEYGTAVANQKLSVYSLANIGSSTGEKIPEGTSLKVIRAFAPTTTAVKCHMVEYKGKIVYIMIWSSNKTPLFRDVKVEGKLDLNDLPANAVPKHNEGSEPEQPKSNGYEYKNLSIWNFTATAGKAPEIRFNTAEKLVKSVVYSENIVQKPYTRVTATVTYKIEDGDDYFTENPTISVIETNAICGYEIISKSKDTVVVRFTTVSDNGETRADITQEMKDFQEYMSNNSIARIPTKSMGKLSDSTGKAKLYAQPLMLNVKNDAPKNLYIHDIQNFIPDLSGWYYVSDLKALHGFIPAVYVTDISEYDTFEGAPGVNKTTPFEFAGGSGTIEDPYLVQTAEQLNSIRYKPNMHYKLIADIDLSKWGNWTPIGGTPAYGGYPDDSVNTAHRGSAYFSGSLDGNGHAISGMQIIINEDKPYMYAGGNSRYYGLFAMVSTNRAHENPAISNLDLVNYNIDITYGDAIGSVGVDTYWLGSFAGYAIRSTLVNCHAYGGSIKISFAKTDGNVLAGGITGQTDTCILSRCSNASDVTVVVKDATLTEYTLQGGGITGKLVESNNISECYNSGDVILPLTGKQDPYNKKGFDFHWTNSYAGGIASETAPVLDSKNTSYVTNCYNSGNITARAVNDIVVYNGTSTKLYVENYYNVGKLTYNPDEEGAEPGARDQLIPSTYKTNCTTNGNAVSGAQWQKSQALGRMVLKSHPEDMPMRSSFNFVASIVGGFTDVLSDAWYAAPVKWAVDKGITNGTAPDKFSPNDTCTRAQILTFLWRAAGSPQSSKANPFKDVKTTDYFYQPALWAYEKGIVSGNVLSPNNKCTRGETVIYLYKSAGSPESDQINQFNDVPSSNALLNRAVSWAYANNITGGTSHTTFSPNDTCTRGHIVTFLYRAFK